MLQLVGVYSHRAELVHAEREAQIANTRLHKKRLAARGDREDQRYDQQQRRKEYEQEGGAGDIEQSLAHAVGRSLISVSNNQRITTGHQATDQSYVGGLGAL